MGGVRTLAAMAIAVAALASRASPADEAPAKPESAKPLRLALEAGKTYLYRCTQSTKLRVPGTALRLEHAAFALGEGGEGPPVAEISCTTVWEAGVTLARTESDGTVVVTLFPTRVSGAAKSSTMPEAAFDSDDPKSPRPFPLVGCALSVRLAPTGRVIDAAPAPAGQAAAKAKVSPQAAADFAQRFFQELPQGRPHVPLSWDAMRALVPEFVLHSGYVERIQLGAIGETATVKKCGTLAVEAMLRARLEAPAVPAPVTGTAAETIPKSAWRPRVLREELAGHVSIDRATGLVATRRTSVYVEARRDEIPLKGGRVDLPATLGRPARTIELPTSYPAQDETYEIETLLEAVDPR